MKAAFGLVGAAFGVGAAFFAGLGLDQWGKAQRKKEKLEDLIRPYGDYVLPKPDPVFSYKRANGDTKPATGLLALIAFESDHEVYTMDLSAAQGRLNLIKSDYYLLKDNEEQKGSKAGSLWRGPMKVGHSWRAPVAAARFGHLETLKWFEPGWLRYKQQVVDAAKEGEHVDILSYVDERTKQTPAEQQ